MINQDTFLSFKNNHGFLPFGRLLSNALFLLLVANFSHSLHAATITQNQFLGVSNILDRDASCTGPTNGSVGSCFVQERKLAKQESQVFGPVFDRFDRSLGTLNSVNLSYNIETWRHLDFAP